MNKKELIAYAEEKGCANVEFYRYTNNKMKRIHTDYIEYIDDYVADNAEIEDFAIMNEDDYNHSIYANCGERADFAEEYDNTEATVMIAIVEATDTL